MGDKWMSVAAQAVLVMAGVLDPVECKSFLVKDDELKKDATILMARWAELWDMPPAWDADRLPARQQIDEACSFNRAMRLWLSNRLPNDHLNAEQLHDAIQDLDRRYVIWDLARDARSTYCWVSGKRKALDKLRDLIGDEAYYSGRLPSHIRMEDD